MTRLRSVMLAAPLLAVLVGCGAPAPAAAPPAAPASAAQPPPGAVALTGAVKAPGTLTHDALAALPQQTAQVSFGSSKGTEQHTESGVALTALLPVDKLATTDRKHDELAFAVLAIGADGYAASVSFGEVAPDFGNRGVLVALTEDGKALDRPRLVVPGDVKGGRYVSDLVELRVVRLG